MATSYLALAFRLITIMAVPSYGAIYDLQSDGGAVPDDDSLAVSVQNAAAFNKTLANLSFGDTLIVPKGVFHVMGGIYAQGLVSATLHIDGEIVLSKDMKAWPHNDKGKVRPFFHFQSMKNFTITSSSRGVIDGKGATWWGPPGIGYLERVENRPVMLHVANSSDVLLEKIFFKDPPYHTAELGCDGLEVRWCEIQAWRVSHDQHTIIDLTAFNTDGFDVSGRNIWIHDCTIWNQDDTFCIKDHTENVLIERVNASGMGLTIGSISSHVRNITFRDCYMRNTYKGIYMKFRDNGLIENVLYENIVMDEPEQWPIWIGPAQQSDSRDPCAAHPCSLCWPSDPLARCNSPARATYRNITLRNITVNNPKKVPGVIMAASTSPMENITFDSVVVNNPSKKKEKWGSGYFCDGVKSGVAVGTTSPVPHCFLDRTEHATTSMLV